MTTPTETTMTEMTETTLSARAEVCDVTVIVGKGVAGLPCRTIVVLFADGESEVEAEARGMAEAERLWGEAVRGLLGTRVRAAMPHEIASFADGLAGNCYHDRCRDGD